MQFVNIHDAKTNLSKYLEQVVKGQETVVICKNGEPIAQLTPYNKKREIKFGLARGQIWIAPDFDEIPSEFKDYIE